MKYLFITIFSLLLYSCNDLTFDSQEIIEGRISATEKGYNGEYPHKPKIWVQTPKRTEEISIPFEYEGRWKVGDTCLLIIQKYIETSKK